MHRTQFEVRDTDGTLLDIGDFINCPDLADDRIGNCLKYYPAAAVTRTEDPDWHEGKVATAPATSEVSR
jgi:hypothetical protein